MSSSGLRVEKSQSMVLSLFSLSGIALVLLILFLLVLFAQLFSHLSLEKYQEIGFLFPETLLLIFVALVVSLPIATGLTYLAVAWSTSKMAPSLNLFLKFVGEAPALLYGLVFFYYMGAGRWALATTLVLLGATQLSRRWIKLSSRVDILSIESMQSLGFSVWQIIHRLYVKQFLKQYIYHFFSVVCSLFVIVTPFLCIEFYNETSLSWLSLEFYKNLGIDLEKTSLLAFVILIAHAIRVWLDQQTSFWEVEFG